MMRNAPHLPPPGCALLSRPVFRWLVYGLCAWFALGGPDLVRAQTPVSKEYQIKAAYLYNFAKFVEWPAGSFTNSDAPLVIGVFGANPFGDALHTIAQDHQINGRKIVIKPVASAADACGVHLLFFSGAEDGRIADELAALKKSQVLTVGESDAFAAAGGAIDFVREADKVRFEINATAVERQGLKISAQLLKLARHVRRDP